jgi:hypothetical protein
LILVGQRQIVHHLLSSWGAIGLGLVGVSGGQVQPGLRGILELRGMPGTASSRSLATVGPVTSACR